MSSLTNSQVNERSMNGLVNIEANSGVFDEIDCNTLNVALSGTAPTMTSGDSSTHIATTAFVSNAIGGAGAGYVDLTTNQTVGGIKTFSSVPLCATAPTTSLMLTNKAYVDSMGVSTATNNTWTGFNQFRQETGVFDATTTNKLSMDIYNPAITSTTGSSSNCVSGASMNPYNIVVPAGNYCRTVYMRMSVNLYGAYPILYTGDITLSYTSVSVVITKNGGAYGGSPTAILTNSTSTSKPWTGIVSNKFILKAYLGYILVSFNIDVNNTSTDIYAIYITPVGSNTSVPAITFNTEFLAEWSALFTSTNSQTSGTFGGTNPVNAGSSNFTDNTIVSNNTLNVISTSGTTLTASNLNLIADTGYWTAISNSVGNFYYRTFSTVANLILGSQTAIDYFTIGASATGTTLSTTNQPITISSGSATTTISAGGLTVSPLATFSNGLTSSALTTINNDLRLTQSTIPATNTSQLGYILNASAFPTSSAISNITWTTFGGNVSVPSKGVWLFIGNINIRNTAGTTLELMKIVLTATAGSGTPIGTANYIEEGNRTFTGANDPTASMSVQTVFTTTGSATYYFQVYIQMTTVNIQTASANPGTWSLTRIG